MVRAAAAAIVGSAAAATLEPVAEGVSTYVYRLRRGHERLYLRVLPEASASFAPEAYAHRLLRTHGVRVPDVLHVEDHNQILQRSVMVTTEIPGRSVAAHGVDASTDRVVAEAGQDLAIINRVAVSGYGWIRREPGPVMALAAELPTAQDFVHDHLLGDLSILRGRVLSEPDLAAISRIVADHPAWWDNEPAHLAHGDLDLTHIFLDEGRYTGIIDLGEMRGAPRWYDLGHFRLHDGEALPIQALPWLLEGYQRVTPLPPDIDGRMTFWSLLIALRALARSLIVSPPSAAAYQAFMRRAIARDLAALQSDLA